MNIMMNNYCNLHCPYCFAQDEMNGHVTNNISEENFKTYLDFLKKSESTEIRMIGGEPTLHPDIIKLIDIAASYNYFDSILIFSNFTFGLDLAEKFVEADKKIPIRFLPNVNDKPEIRNKIETNYDYLTTCMPEDRVNRIGINIYQPDQDLSLWEELICKYNLEKVRWSIVVPNNSLSEDFNFKEYFHSFQNVLLRLVNWIPRFGVNLSCDCNGLPVCAYDPEAVVEMVKIAPDFMGPMYCSGGALDITPDLYVRGCFGNSSYRKPLKDFENENEIMIDVNNARKSLEEKCPQESCLSCARHMSTGNCCSCLQYRK